MCRCRNGSVEIAQGATGGERALIECSRRKESEVGALRASASWTANAAKCRDGGRSRMAVDIGREWWWMGCATRVGDVVVAAMRSLKHQQPSRTDDEGWRGLGLAPWQ
jgi:hypothetical protein